MGNIRIELSLGNNIAIKDITIQLTDENGNISIITPQNNSKKRKEEKFIAFMQTIICQLEKNGQIRTTEAYQSTLRSFKKYRKGKDIELTKFDAELTADYEQWLLYRNITKNTISFYMRILRAVYNRAVYQKLTSDKRPFTSVYTGIGHTQKRALSIEDIKKINRTLLIPQNEILARDLFMFSFYTRGMSFVDMAYLKKNDVKNGYLHYKRHKTKQQLTVRWEKNIQYIVNRHNIAESPYLLPIITASNGKERQQYRYRQSMINKWLREIGENIGLSEKLTMYVARHSWASIAKELNIPLEIISKAMGHTSERTTQIYLKSIENDIIDQTNKNIIQLLSD